MDVATTVITFTVIIFTTDEEEVKQHTTVSVTTFNT